MIKTGLCRINEHRMLPPEAIATNYIFTSVLFERVIESCTIIHSTCDSCDSTKRCAPQPLNDSVLMHMPSSFAVNGHVPTTIYRGFYSTAKQQQNQY